MCTTKHAVYLEIVQDLTANNFLLAFCKFAGWRSLLKLMISDNGSKYLPAAEELRSLMELLCLRSRNNRIEEVSPGALSPRELHGMEASRSISGAYQDSY